jgi:peptidoglycan-associated lipoprotein
MQKAWLVFATLSCLGVVLHAQAIPSEIGVRYSAQISNGPAGSCGCFTLQGAAADFNWNLPPKRAGAKPGPRLSLAFDAGMEHTGNMNGVGYGLTLSTFAAGPRLTLPVRRVRPFAQALFGMAHGANSEFPQSSTLSSSANSFALDLGAGADLPLNKHLALRFLQLDYLRTALPNNTTNWQNNLRIGAGLTLYLSHQ